MADIFISYDSEDRDRVIPIVKALEEHGWSLFWDSASIPVGKTWRQFIDEGLEAARCIMVIWSKQSVASEWVLEEADEGKQRKILVPAMVDDIRPPRGFGQIQAARLIGWKGESSHSGFQQLIKALTGLLGPPKEQVPAPEPPITAPRKPKPAEATIDETKLAEPKLLEIKSDITKPSRKFLPSKITALIAIVLVIVVGAILLFRQEPEKSITEISAPQVKPEEPQVATKPSETSLPKKFTNSKGMEFVLIPAGSFTMGSSTGNNNERPPHSVRISQSFYLQTTEVRQGQWKLLMGDNPSSFKECGDDCPVENVPWVDVQRFIEKLNLLETTKGYRLPSEAEWEYACRAGTTTEYSFGDDSRILGEYAWYLDNSNNKTHRVATRKPNHWGLYDMHGNVGEWVEDIWHGSYQGAPADGRAWVVNRGGSNHVIRGGSLNYGARDCRSAARFDVRFGFRSLLVGFRLSRSVALGP